MKQNLRKILAMFTLAVSVLGLTACGSSSANDEISYDRTQLELVADTLIQVWGAMSAEDMQEFIAMDEEDVADMIEYYGTLGSPFGSFTAESMTSAFASYDSSREDLGDYVSTIGYEAEVKGDEVVLNTSIQYTNREAVLSIVFNHRGVAQSVTLDPKYGTDEILIKAGLNTVLGMGTVFIVLIFISLIIYCFNFIPNIQAKFGGKKKEEAKAAAPAPAKAAPVPAPVPAAEELADDGELVAAITAAICAYSGTSSDGFVVRSIRRADNATWKRV